jgi:hypothetical protein
MEVVPSLLFHAVAKNAKCGISYNESLGNEHAKKFFPNQGNQRNEDCPVSEIGIL